MSRGKRFESARRLSNTLRLHAALFVILSVRLVQTICVKMAAVPLDSGELGHFSFESYLSAGTRTLTDILLRDEQGVIVASFGWNIEQYSGLAFAQAGERAGADVLISRDEPQLVVATWFGLLEVIELQFHLLVARGLRPDFGHTPVPFEP